MAAAAIFLLASSVASAVEADAPIRISLSEDRGARPVSPDFLGLSYETREVLLQNGRYYFDPEDSRLVSLFATLGVRSLRIGGNAVDDLRVPVPLERDIDSLFRFARAAKVKVIYSFRLRDGDPALAARLAGYIHAHYADCLDCFCIGNEPDKYLKTYPAYLAAFVPEYEAILKAVPSAQFEGPAGADWTYAVQFASDYFARGHLKMASAHSYPLGGGRAAEQHPALALKQFMAAESLAESEKFNRDTCAPLAGKGIPYRMDEANSCWDGGARGASDAYASALWGFEYLNWWAAHHIAGINFHTGDSVNGNPPMAANYAAFVHDAGRGGFAVRPLAYGMLAFSQVAMGTPLTARQIGTPVPELSAYAYATENEVRVALINRSYGDSGRTLNVSLELPRMGAAGTWMRMDLTQKGSDVSAKGDIELGTSGITPDGIWGGKWRPLAASGSPLTVNVAGASVALLRFRAIP